MLKNLKSQIPNFKLFICLCSVACVFASVSVYASIENNSSNADSQAITSPQGAAGANSAAADSQPEAASAAGAILKDIIPKEPSPYTKPADKSPEIKLAQADSETSTDTSAATGDTGTADSSSVSTLSSPEEESLISPSSSANSFSSVKLDMQSNSGFAVTSIPIELPPGRNGMMPKLALYCPNNQFMIPRI